MRVTSSLWVGAFVRRCTGEGMFAAVIRRGADEAGVIFIVLDKLDGSLDLYGPAPQSSFDEAHPSDRLFQKIATAVDQPAVDARLAKEGRFDPDFWVVAVEDRAGRTLFDVVGG
ncbi:MAG TPA: DUF1491 family protein [Bauldia sp.]|nr:DUF1491 family protein [Bauldia sp.]